MNAKHEALKSIEEQIEMCRLCGLCEGRTNTVPGTGSFDSEIMFIGEGPGKDEDLQGKPFVGAAGKFLTVLIESIGLSRNDVFITNVVKCRPPGNRDPEQIEVNTCWRYLEAQISLIKPKLIVTLGRHSMQRFLPGLRISEAHGKAKRIKGIWSEKQVIFPMYHPAAALYNPALRQVMLADMTKIPVLLKKIEI
ncbi:uracil-DNA glycosylase [Candidatus Peregrinibacteria bacterium]|nr:uracil-DNA glycosylase [Candidatus Peregrinibacteria bacterium]